MTDKELRDAAVAELKLTTAGWRKPNGNPNYPSGTAPSSTHWGKAMSMLDQIGQAAPPPPPPPPPTTFAKYAAPNGSDSNPGTEGSPYRTFTKLCNSLSPGQTGALRAGTYTGGNVTGNGTASQRIRVTGYPGEVATVTEKIDISASYRTFDHFKIVSSGGSFMAWYPGLLLEYMDISQSPRVASAIYLGGCDDSIIRYCKLHDFGANGHFDHGVYAGRGARMHIHHNWIWNNNNGWGIQIYSHPNTSVFEHNIIDKCGAGFVISDGGTRTSYDNLIHRNVVLNSVGTTFQAGAALSGSGPVAGSNNLFSENCSFNNPNGIGSAPNVIMAGNFNADPQFVDAANHDYAVKPSSPLANWGLWDGR